MTLFIKGTASALRAGLQQMMNSKCSMQCMHACNWCYHCSAGHTDAHHPASLTCYLQPCQHKKQIMLQLFECGFVGAAMHLQSSHCLIVLRCLLPWAHQSCLVLVCPSLLTAELPGPLIGKMTLAIPLLARMHRPTHGPAAMNPYTAQLLLGAASKPATGQANPGGNWAMGFFQYHIAADMTSTTCSAMIASAC